MNLYGNKVFCDTSFFFAALCANDRNYGKAGTLLEYCSDNAVTLCTTWDIVSESVTLLRYRADYRTAVQFLDDVKPTLQIVPYDDSARTAASEVFKKLSKDKRLSYCDALSYVIVTQVLDHVPCFAFDKDFRNLGLTVYP